MNSERARAYGRVVKALDDTGAGELTPDERDRVRQAADAMFFCEDAAGDPSATLGLADVEALTEQLVADDRWREARAKRLLRDVSACGPLVAA